MKIWLDLRFIKDNIYSAFIIELTKGLIKNDTENDYIIYTNNFIEWFDFLNVSFKNVSIKNASIKEQTKYLKILKKDNNNLMIFFNHYKPIFYRWNYFILLHSLKEIYYSNFNNYFEKYTYLYLLEKNLKESKKIICFDNHTIEELIEKYNIEEKKIKTLQWFFPNVHNNIINLHDNTKEIEKLNVNIKTKYDIKNDFFIYSWWEWAEKNYEKLVHVLNKLKNDWYNIDLVFLWESISKNVALRNVIINLQMQNNTHFIWVLKHSEKVSLYKESLWVIFPSFYEPFPFRLSEPIHFNIPIIASDLKNIKHIFWDTINYISAISVNNIYEKVKNYLDIINFPLEHFDDLKITKNVLILQETKYENIKNKYSKENSINQLLEIIK